MTTTASAAHKISGAEGSRRSIPRPFLAIVGHSEGSRFGQSFPAPAPAISFGRFQLLPSRRLLLEAGKPLAVGSRALDVLIALVGRAGEVVGKDTLMAHVWPKTTVEEGNLKVQVAALRKILGDGQDGRRYVVNVHGRGYVFAAPVRRDNALGSASPAEAECARNLPAPGLWKKSA